MQPSVRVDNGNDHQDPAGNGNNIVQQETWVLLADELWTEDNGNDAVCNGNCMRNDYRLRIVRAISMNRELESSMVQCNDHRSARQIKKSTCGQVDMNLCYNYHCSSTLHSTIMTTTTPAPRCCMALLRGGSMDGTQIKCTVFWTHANALMDCTLF